MTIKEFLNKHKHIKSELKHIDFFGGGWEIKIYNTITQTRAAYFISDEELDKCYVDFDKIVFNRVDDRIFIDKDESKWS